MNPCPKTKPFRSPALCELASLAPHCMNPHCEVHNDGSVVMCHSNHLRHGKGKGVKAHDLGPFLCPWCHDHLDGRRAGWDNEQKEYIFNESLYCTLIWLLENGHLEVHKIPSKRRVA